MEKDENSLLLERRISALEEQVRQLQKLIADLEPNKVQEVTTEDPETVVLETIEQIEQEPVVNTEVTSDVPSEEPVVETIATEEEPVVETIAVEEEIISETSSIINEPEEEVEVEETAQPTTHQHPSTITQELFEEEPTNSWETQIGKKIIPIAASALILIALILFGSLIRPYLTDGAKAIIMAIVSLGITGVGLWKMKPEGKYHNFFSALAGCGVSACYITSLVSHFSLEVLSEIGLMACISVWIVCLILLSKFKSQMFSYICYVGILIAAAMTVQRWNDTPIGLISYLISIGALFGVNFTKDYKKALWYFVQLPIVLLPMSGAYASDTLSQIIIYAVSVAALIGQTAYYIRHSETIHGIEVPTLLSIAPIGLSCYLIDSYGFHANSLLFAATMIGICIYNYRTFIVSLQKNHEFAFWIPFAISLYALPILNYGDTYSFYCGYFLVPAIAMLTLGCRMRNKIFTYAGLLYTLLFALKYPDAYQTTLASGNELNYGCWIYIAILAATFVWVKRIGDQLTQSIIVVGSFFFFAQLWYCNWISIHLAYLLVIAYLALLHCRPFKVQEYSLYPEVSNVVFYTIAFIGFNLNYYYVFYSDNSKLLELPGSIGTPICATATTMFLWSVGYFQKHDLTIRVSYILMPILFFTMTDYANTFLAFICYIAMIAIMVRNVVLHYSENDKLYMALLGITIPALALNYDIIGFNECWMLWAVYSVALFIKKFFCNPTTGEEESKNRNFCIAFNGVTLAIGTLLLRYNGGPLHIWREIPNTEFVTVSLQILLCMALAATDVKYLYSKINDENERVISLYQGLKFTILFWVIMSRLSTVSYIISIIGIILAVIFVTAGFKYQFKSLRLYGLCLSMLCVVKLIFFDIVFDNAFFRAGSFLVAGLLLFLISFIYFRLEKKNTQK